MTIFKNNFLLSKKGFVFIFLINLLLLFYGINIFKKGMFLDGTTYACISRNLSIGLGSFWCPHYTNSLYPSFYEHPPLFFIITSFLYKLFGDIIYLDKLISFSLLILTILTISKFWKYINDKEESIKSNSFLPILIYISTPIVIWSYNNNILENLMSLFCLLSVLFYTKYAISRRLFYLMLASILVVFGVFTKGLSAFFPIITVFIYSYIFNSKTKEKTFANLWIIGIPIMLIVVTTIVPEIKNNLISYYHSQIYKTFISKRDSNSPSHLLIIFQLGIVLFTIYLIPLVLLIHSHFNKTKFEISKKSMFFFFVGLSASIPIAISEKQHEYYLLPSLIYFVFSSSFLILGNFHFQISKLNLKYITYANLFIFIFLLLVFYSSIGKYSRDEVIIKDIEKIVKIVPKGENISTDWDNYSNWGLIALLNRYGCYSLEYNSHRKYYVILNKQKSEISSNYLVVKVKLNRLKLYKLKNN
jgi:4-amino-4-deoxy-L-arabinose transferase-like glycosyltransferase